MISIFLLFLLHTQQGYLSFFYVVNARHSWNRERGVVRVEEKPQCHLEMSWQTLSTFLGSCDILFFTFNEAPSPLFDVVNE